MPATSTAGMVPGSTPISLAMRSPWRSWKYIDHLDDLADDVHVGSHHGQRAVEEEHVLHVQHELLGHARAVAEEPLGEVADLGGELLGGEGGGVDGRAVEPEVSDHRVDVDVERERAEVAHGRDLRRDVVGGRRHDESEEGQALGLVEAARDPEVEEGDAAVGLHEQVAPVQVSVEHAVEQGPFEEGDQRGVQDGLGVDPRRRASRRRRPTRSRRGVP